MTAASLTASTMRPTVAPALNRASVLVTVVESDRRALIAKEASGASVLPARGAVAQHGGLLGQGLAGRLGHRLLESRDDGLGRERLQLFDQRLQLRQSLGGHARVEIVTPLDVQEHRDERVRYLAAVRDEHIEHREEMVEPVAEAGELTADADERGVGDTHAAVVLPVQHAERLQSREHGGVGLDAEVAREVGLTPHLGALGEPRAQRSPVEGDGLLSRRSGWAADEAADRGEVEALLLQARDELEPSDVLGPVVAGAALEVRRREQPAGDVRADVADGQAGPGGKLLNGEQLRILGHAIQRKAVRLRRTA